jgi:O-antigen ligase
MSHLGRLNEAHNGYLEVYLELGLIGDGLLAIFLIISYRQACRRLASDRALAIFGMAAWMMIVFYNMSEAAFEGGLLFMMLLLGTIVVPARLRAKLGRPADKVRPVAVFEAAPVSEQVLDFSS